MDHHEQAPWDRYPEEPAEAFSCFVRFRDAGLARSLDATTQALGGAYSFGWIVACASAWHWRARVEAYDLWRQADRDLHMAELQKTRAARWERKQIELAETMTSLLEVELARMQKRQADGVPLRDATLMNLIATLHKNQQIATGGPTEIVDNRIDLENLTPEARVALEAARGALEQLAKG